MFRTLRIIIMAGLLMSLLLAGAFAAIAAAILFFAPANEVSTAQVVGGFFREWGLAAPPVANVTWTSAELSPTRHNLHIESDTVALLMQVRHWLVFLAIIFIWRSGWFRKFAAFQPDSGAAVASAAPAARVTGLPLAPTPVFGATGERDHRRCPSRLTEKLLAQYASESSFRSRAECAIALSARAGLEMGVVFLPVSAKPAASGDRFTSRLEINVHLAGLLKRHLRPYDRLQASEDGLLLVLPLLQNPADLKAILSRLQAPILRLNFAPALVHVMPAGMALGGVDGDSFAELANIARARALPDPACEIAGEEALTRAL